jgi:zinc-ribbon domain
MLCQDCGAYIRSSARFCTRCGVRLYGRRSIEYLLHYLVVVMVVSVYMIVPEGWVSNVIDENVTALPEPQGSTSVRISLNQTDTLEIPNASRILWVIGERITAPRTTTVLMVN